ncbi:FG-nucleoporin nsp1 [Trapelia coarctata]|nr:FG-nucleoporin nsp1 [Trapelia coarctata]
MSDPPKSTPTFSFGTDTGGSILFGSTQANNTPGSVFGSGAAATGANSFGSASATSSSSTTFGSTPATSVPQSTLFGGGAGTGQPRSLFGGQSSGGGNNFGGNTGTTSGFSGFSTPSKPSETPATSGGQSSNSYGGASISGSNLFGGLGPTPATSSQAGAATPTAGKLGGGFSYGTVSTTPAGPPPAGNTTSGTGFNFTKPQEQKSSVFGGFGTQPSSQAPPAQSAPSNPFNVAPSGNRFGSSKPTDSTATTSAPQPTSNMFGNSPATSGSSHFSGLKPASEPAPSTFTTLGKSSDGAGQTTQAEASKLGSFFSGPNAPKPSDAPSSMFSSTGKDTSSATTKPTFGFPSATTAPTTVQSSAPTATTSSSANLFAGLGAQTVASPTATVTSAEKPPDIFANLGAGKDKAPATSMTSSAAPSLTTAPASGSLFDRTTKPSEPGSSAQPAVQATTATSTAAGDDASRFTNLGASTTGPKPPAQSRLKNKSMDEIITRWASDLAKYQKEFQKQALKVSEWDRLLVENSDKIQKLYGSTLEAERATAEVERQLSAVENDQAELEYWLEHYEKQVDEMMSSQVGQGDALQGPDQERERTYKLTEKLSDRLNDLSKDLTSMVENINDASSNLSKNSKTDDPLSHIVRVLNGHLSQLQQIDQGTAALQAKVVAAQRASRSAAPMNGMNGLGNDAADDFYRSYMGRR